MSSKFTALSDEEKVRHAIDCVARGVPIPEPLRLFLLEHDLLERIEAPREQATSD